MDLLTCFTISCPPLLHHILDQLSVYIHLFLRGHASRRLHPSFKLRSTALLVQDAHTLLQCVFLPHSDLDCLPVCSPMSCAVSLLMNLVSAAFACLRHFCFQTGAGARPFASGPGGPAAGFNSSAGEVPASGPPAL